MYCTLVSSTATPNPNVLQGGIVKHRYLGREVHNKSNILILRFKLYLLLTWIMNLLSYNFLKEFTPYLRYSFTILKLVIC